MWATESLNCCENVESSGLGSFSRTVTLLAAMDTSRFDTNGVTA